MVKWLYNGDIAINLDKVAVAKRLGTRVSLWADPQTTVAVAHIDFKSEEEAVKMLQSWSGSDKDGMCIPPEYHVTA